MQRLVLPLLPLLAALLLAGCGADAPPKESTTIASGRPTAARAPAPRRLAPPKRAPVIGLYLHEDEDLRVALDLRADQTFTLTTISRRRRQRRTALGTWRVDGLGLFLRYAVVEGREVEGERTEVENVYRGGTIRLKNDVDGYDLVLRRQTVMHAGGG